MRVLLVGNYAPDVQQSMRRFGALLRDGLQARGADVRLLAPAARWGGRPGHSPYAGAEKWRGYGDKYLAFPSVLRREIRRFRPDVVHVCDHSNAVYVPPARRATGGRSPVVVTCHDLGAVRGALGEAAATFCPASRTGAVLQRWIARGLAQADHVACDTAATAADVRRLIAGPPATSVVHLGFQAPYRALPAAEADARLAAAGVDAAVGGGGPFLLHVGSGLPRKNREGVLRTFAAALRSRPDLRLVFAGEALTGETAALAAQAPVAGRVVSLVDPADAVVEALYSRALALVFPSRFEGFGWPVIEAQACGCPVVCGDTPALAEVAGAGAFIRGPDDAEAFADHLGRLAADPAERARRVAAGHANAARFDTARMVDDYLALYRQLARP